MTGHLSEDDLERHHMGKVKGDELGAMEDHLLWCGTFIDRAEATAQYVDAMSGIGSSFRSRACILSKDQRRTTSLGRDRAHAIE